MRRLRHGEWIAGAAGAALLLSLFLPWYRIAFGPLEGPSGTAWEAFAAVDVVLALLALVPLTLVVVQATRPSPSVPVAFSVLTTLAGALAALLILWRLLDQPGPNDVVEVRPAAWLALAAALLAAAGGWRSMRAESIPRAPLPPIEDLPAPS
jgi:uncharacterized membrane protein